MFDFNNNPENRAKAKSNWKYQLDRFVKENEQELAALAWGLLQEWGESRNDTLGIDLKPKPHFVACSRESIEDLNKKVNNRLQEILGVLDNYKKDEEVVMIGIGDGQIQLINFKPVLPPSRCFTELNQNIDSLIQLLEERLETQINKL